MAAYGKERTGRLDESRKTRSSIYEKTIALYFHLMNIF